MSTTQEEIASNNSLDTVNRDTNKLNRTLLYLAMTASVIVFSVGLTVFIYTINTFAAAFMPITLLFAAYPVFKLIKLRAFYLLLVLIEWLIFLACLCLMFMLIPSGTFKYISVFLICFLLLFAVSVSFLIAVSISKTRVREYSGIIAVLFFTALSVMLLIFFKDSPVKGFSFQLWPGTEIKFPLNSTASIYANIGGFSIGAIFLAAYLFMEKSRHFDAKYITYVATFSALSVIFKLMGNAATVYLSVALGPWFKFTLVYIPWIAAGIVIGPGGAMIAAFIGDLLGQLLLPAGGPWFWLTGVANVLLPLFPALIYRYLPLSKKFDWLKLLIGMVVSSVVCTMGLSTLSFSIIYGIEYWALFVSRLPQLIVVGINYALLVILLPTLRRAKLHPPKLIKNKS